MYGAYRTIAPYSIVYNCILCYECAFMVILCQFDVFLTMMVPMTHMTPKFKCLSLIKFRYIFEYGALPDHSRIHSSVECTDSYLPH